MRIAEAVTDKDTDAGIMAADLHADRLLTSAASLDWGTSAQEAQSGSAPALAGRATSSMGFMGPKIADAVAFVGALGRGAGIGKIDKCRPDPERWRRPRCRLAGCTGRVLSRRPGDRSRASESLAMFRQLPRCQ